MKGKPIASLWDHDGEVVWVEFDLGGDVNCGFEEGPSTVIDDLVRQFRSGLYRVNGNKLILCEDESVQVFAFNTLISGFYEWSEEEAKAKLDDAFAAFRKIEEELHAYSYAQSMIYLDSVTAAPADTAEDRGRVLGVLSGVAYEKMTGEETKKLVAELLAGKSTLTPAHQREVEVFNRDNEWTSKIPKQEYVEYQMLVSDAESVWHKAKLANDFASFAPYLKKIVEYNRRFAQYNEPDKAPYDVLLDQYERGFTMKSAEEFFAALRNRLVPLIRKIQSVPQVDDSFLYRSYPVEKQREFSDYLMQVMGIDRNHCTIGETEHPFTLEFNKNDVRITTHYHENNVASSLFAVIHEGGHALYELHSGDEYEGTCLAGGISMGIHESQSRLFENLIGRSRAFLQAIFPKMQELFPAQLADITAEDLYRAVNKSEPSLIRIEADELTYSLHVMVRYELEKGLIDGSISVEELPQKWNEKMREYLGVEVPDDTHGVLQDSHWSGGAIGYFPSYALGSAYGAQMLAKLRESVDVDGAIANGNLGAITDWLEEKIYRHGKRYDPKELFELCCGAPFDPEYYVAYLEQKFSEIYGL